jgi:hypothetical protein
MRGVAEETGGEDRHANRLGGHHVGHFVAGSPGPRRRGCGRRRLRCEDESFGVVCRSLAFDRTCERGRPKVEGRLQSMTGVFSGAMGPLTATRMREPNSGIGQPGKVGSNPSSRL